MLAAAGGGLNRDLAKDLGVDAGTVGRWRRRWAARPRASASGRRKRQRLALAPLRYRDAGGCPALGLAGDLPPEQIIEIIAIACEPPEASQRPISHWTPREVAEEAVKRNIVPRISVRTVGRFLKSGGS